MQCTLVNKVQRAKCLLVNYHFYGKCSYCVLVYFCSSSTLLHLLIQYLIILCCLSSSCPLFSLPRSCFLNLEYSACFTPTGRPQILCNVLIPGNHSVSISSPPLNKSKWKTGCIMNYRLADNTAHGTRLTVMSLGDFY